MNSNTINVEKIMDEIRREIQSKNFSEIIDFEETPLCGSNIQGSCEAFNMNDFMYELSVSNQTYIVPTSFPIEGKFKFIKRIIRKLSFFITGQSAAVLTEFNVHIIRVLNQVRNFIFEQEKADAEQKKCISETSDLTSALRSHSDKIKKLSNENKALTEKLARLEKTAEAYRESFDNSKAQIDILKEKLDIMEQKYQMLNEKR